MEDRKSRVMLKGSQAKAIFMQRSYLRVISGSSGRPFYVSFSLQGSRDLEEHDQISLVAIWHCSDVILRFLNRNKEASPTETKARRRRQSCAQLRYQFSRYGLLSIISFQICICVYGYHNSSLFLILSLVFPIG